jgi:tetratricopeptide (TPR) repeat protein
MIFRADLAVGGIAMGAIVLSLIIYSGSLSGPYLFDDLPAYNGGLDRVSFPPVTNWLHPETRPLLQVWFAIIRRFSDSPVAAYRVSGVLLHVFNCLMFFVLIRCIDRQVRAHLDSMMDQTRLSGQIAWIASWIWLVHPLCVQAVCSIIQQAELLMSMFFLCYLIVVATSRSRPRWISAMMAYLCLACGIHTKVVMIAAVPVGLLLDALLSNASVKQVLKTNRQLHLIPLLGAFLLAIALIPMLLAGQAGIGFGGDAPPTEIYLMSSFRSLAIYLGLTFWPASLAIDRGPHFITDWSQASPYAIGVAIYVGLACFAWSSGFGKNTTRRLLGWLMLSPLFILVPTSSFVPTADPVFEHRFYLPLAFIVSAVVLMGYEISFKRFGDLGYFRKASVAMVSLIVVMLSIRASIRGRDYASSIQAWRSALMVDGDNARAAQNFVATLQRQERDHEIADEIIKLMVIADSRGGNVEALAHQLAKDYLRNGKADKALPILSEVVSRSQPFEALITDRQRREFGERWFDLAIACTVLNRPTEGIDAILQTLRVSPRDPFAHALAADIYEMVGDQDLASRHRKASEDFAKDSLNLVEPAKTTATE